MHGIGTWPTTDTGLPPAESRSRTAERRRESVRIERRHGLMGPESRDSLSGARFASLGKWCRIMDVPGMYM